MPAHPLSDPLAALGLACIPWLPNFCNLLPLMRNDYAGPTKLASPARVPRTRTLAASKTSSCCAAMKPSCESGVSEQRVTRALLWRFRRILKQVDGLHKQAALTTAGSSEPTEAERERAAQLTAQTAPVTERKHFYRTEVYQVQDALLAEEEDVNGAIALGAAAALIMALMQTTAARCGMHQ